MKLLLQIIALVLVCSQAHAFFSMHAIITPKNVQKHQGYKVWLYTEKFAPDMVNVVIPFHPGDKKYWVFTSKRELTDEELNFRDIIWSTYKGIPDYIDRITPISPTPDDDGKIGEGGFIRLKVRKDALAKTFVYHDFETGVDDGGWYRTYRLSTFPIGEKFDHFIRIEMNISRCERLGDSAKRQEYERELSEMLKSQSFIEKHGQRYLAEQEAAKVEEKEKVEDDGAPSLDEVRLEVEYGHDAMQTLSSPDVDSVEAVPKQLRSAVEAHLKKRLGEHYPKLIFVGLWKVDDLRLLKRAYPGLDSLDDRYVFHLEYAFDFKAIGLKDFRTFIRFRDDLTVFEEIGLPSKAENWPKVHISEVFTEGVSKLRKGVVYGVDFEFNEYSGRMQWVVESNDSNSGSIEIHQAFFDSVTGEFLRLDEYGADGY